jgi:hypothetical protein
MLRMRFPQVVGALASTLVVFSSLVARAQCSKDTDCKGERVCNEGACTAPAPGTAPAPPAAAPAAAAPPPPQTPPGYTLVPVAPAPAAPAPKPETERYSTGMMVAGIFMVSTGPIILLLGISNSCVTTGFDCATTEQVAMTIVGTAMIGVGVPLIVVGSQRVPVRPSAAKLSPWVTPHGAGATLRLNLDL